MVLTCVCCRPTREGPMEPGSLLRTAREAAGVGLREIARRTHYSAAYLSLIESGKRAVPAAVLAAYEKALDSTLERLTAVAKSPASVDTAALEDVAVMLAATRRIEDATGAVAVLPAVRGMSDMAETFAREARTAQATAAGLASEIDQYRGWLEHATGGGSAARRSLRNAVNLAQQSGDPDRLAHGLFFTTYVTMERGDYGAAAALSDAALAVRGVHPVLGVYGRYQRAELLALQGESRQVGKALALADRGAESADSIEPPASAYWYGAGFWSVHRGVVLALLGRNADAVREAAQGVAAMPTEHRRTEWLALMLRQVDPEMRAQDA
ncbi:helix-turn-helix domain-containing protein [Nocardia sp. N2S4-5]|uniref:helix-turn-helix domain-containing protein n=1 Tax=Nocardia sp. N2S4-5 TaxID=3351565 RepID=UPI0037D55A19